MFKLRNQLGFDQKLVSILSFLVLRLLGVRYIIAIQFRTRFLDHTGRQVSIQIYYFKILDVEEVLLLHDSEDICKFLFGSPDKDNTFFHQSGGLKFEFPKIIQSL